MRAFLLLLMLLWLSACCCSAPQQHEHADAGGGVDNLPAHHLPGRCAQSLSTCLIQLNMLCMQQYVQQHSQSTQLSS
jgi:hypothetical protein